MASLERMRKLTKTSDMEYGLGNLTLSASYHRALVRLEFGRPKDTKARMRLKIYITGLYHVYITDSSSNSTSIPEEENLDLESRDPHMCWIAFWERIRKPGWTQVP